ncbi:hypothetical protein VEE55_28290 [Escherichia coli]|nr:hypothetical protein VEE55_28290 [Escherichia coli]GCP27208.1 hypothetical protein ExPECSC014_04403 [Escherichia coli]
MKAFDLHRMAFDKVPFDFLGEVALRSLYTFVLVFLFLKMTGRRGVRQMSLDWLPESPDNQYHLNK